ncbi:alcohol dehydrogenase catalytic domain-containing protein, partial [Campylobacter coli]
PGHEIAGEVIAVGKNVSKFKVGDYAGVGCMVNSCGECDACKRSQEQFCENGKTIFTYNSCDVFHGNENTYGGYSNNI